MKYFYPAVFTFNPKSQRYTAFFPDIPGCRAEGSHMEIAERAREALVQFLTDQEKNEASFPSPSDERMLEKEYPDGRVCIILADTDNYSAYCARCVSCSKISTMKLQKLWAATFEVLTGSGPWPLSVSPCSTCFPRPSGAAIWVYPLFVLSGCLLAYTCEKKGAAGSFPLIAYFRKRIARIYPSLLIMMLVTIGTFSFFAAPVISAIRPEALSVLLGYNNWWQISQSADYFTRLTNQSPFTHLWFLGIELEYYLAWP